MTIASAPAGDAREQRARVNDQALHLPPLMDGFDAERECVLVAEPEPPLGVADRLAAESDASGGLQQFLVAAAGKRSRSRSSSAVSI